MGSFFANRNSSNPDQSSKQSRTLIQGLDKWAMNQLDPPPILWTSMEVQRMNFPLRVLYPSTPTGFGEELACSGPSGPGYSDQLDCPKHPSYGSGPSG